MKKWTKIVEVLDNQVLFFFEPEKREDKEYETLHQVVRVRDVVAELKVSGILPEHRDEVMKSINKKTAELVIKTIEDMMEEGKVTETEGIPADIYDDI